MVLNLLTADVKNLQQMLTAGSITSAGLVDACLAQIRKHDGYLHAMIQTTPLDILREVTRALDEERAAGKVRGPLHGIPVLVKVRVSWIVALSYCGFLTRPPNRITSRHTQTPVFEQRQAVSLSGVPSPRKTPSSLIWYSGPYIFRVPWQITG
ncbi:Putative amidase family protein [Trichoderma simmonsii]|uniref:Amidase family protein n=1 Tax=Trichoderma simmonsii TaxID=1491479 RepID=A0A8G0L5N5_9HYPO|nr:Putative amidase family protein [Trichoderma simmonsii]